MQLIMKKKWVKMRQQRSHIEKAESCAFDYCFPNKLDDIAVLTFAIENGCKKKAPYYLGNLFYDKLTVEEICLNCGKCQRRQMTHFQLFIETLRWLIINKMGDSKAA